MSCLLHWALIILSKVWKYYTILIYVDIYTDKVYDKDNIGRIDIDQVESKNWTPSSTTVAADKSLSSN